MKLDITAIRPCNNNVLLKPAIDTSKIKYGTAEFYAPLSLADGKAYDPFATAPIVCSVAAVPRNLTYGTHTVLWQQESQRETHPEKIKELARHNKKNIVTESEYIEQMIPGSMPWKTTMQLKKGEIVWVNANSLVRAEQNHHTIEVDEELYYIIRYDDIIFKKSGENVVMLNGYLLLSLIDETPDWIKKAKSIGLETLNTPNTEEKYATVRYIGDPVDYPFNDKDRHDHREIKQGDIVMLLFAKNRKLENGQRYFSEEPLIISRRSNIRAIMTP